MADRHIFGEAVSCDDKEFSLHGNKRAKRIQLGLTGVKNMKKWRWRIESGMYTGSFLGTCFLRFKG